MLLSSVGSSGADIVVVQLGSWLIHNEDGVMHAGDVRDDDLAARSRVCRWESDLPLMPLVLVRICASVILNCAVIT
jgi:hypothetical protein